MAQTNKISAIFDSVTDKYILLSSAALLAFGALGSYNDTVISLSIANFFLFLGLRLIRQRKIETPQNFFIYLLFLMIYVAHYAIYGGQLIYLLIYLSAALYWLMFYNIKALLKIYFNYYLISLGLILGVLYTVARIRGIGYQAQDSLFLPVGPNILHNHIGDVWGIILIILIYKAIEKVRKWHTPVFILGAFFMLISLSRSAIASLITGIIYIYYNSQNIRKSKIIIAFTAITASLLFVIFAIHKTILFSRPYFETAISSIVNSPLGIGVGNFYEVSTQSSLTHNIILEFVVGMGMFSLPFIFWLYKTFLTFNKRVSNILYKALFIGLFVNFFFDTTYIIPAMVWLWFAVLTLVYV